MAERFTMGIVELSGEERSLGPYRLLGQLATGGMGIIYLGRDQETGRLAALKTVLAPGGVSTEARKRFRREVELAGRVTSPRTVRVLGSDAEDAKPWMAMEYVPAPSLEALVVQRGALRDVGAVCRVGRGAAEALVELHRRKIVHRDVKPLNILLTGDGPKVIDFGISHASDLTSTRLTLGTIAFAAPEQAEGQSCTAASDVYSLGVTLYYIAAGRLPYPETVEPLQQLNYVRCADIDLDGLPDGLTGPVTACLARDPGDRPTALELLDILADDTVPDALPAGWSTLIGLYAAEGLRLEGATALSEAETVVRTWTTPPTRLLTEPPGEPKRQKKPKKSSQPSRPSQPKQDELDPKAVLRVRNTAKVTVRVYSGGRFVRKIDPGERKSVTLPVGSRNVRLTAPGKQAVTHVYALRRDQVLALEAGVSKGRLYLDRPGAGRPKAAEPTPRPVSPVSPAAPPSPAKTGEFNWAAVVTVVILLAIGVGWLVQHDKNDTSDTADNEPTATASATTDTDTDTDASGTGGDTVGQYGDGGNTGDSTLDDYGDGGSTDDAYDEPAEPETTPLSAEDEEFAAVDVDDCLGDHRDDDDWSSTTPTVASCSAPGSYYRVSSVSEDLGCESEDMVWWHDNDDGTETNLCLNRNYRVGQCMFAVHEGDVLSIYWNAVTDCEASFPDKYEYIVRVTAVSPDGAPEGNCGTDEQWSPENGGAFCGRVVWKRNDMPDL
ncbi:serine/threonine protein kinase [Streptomyces sp. NBC_00334]|uniref:serine/threonine protein kinase n=1 Tax=Streptomyces sp. NBC_00334 TaxID=2975713 RepID=UPI002E2D3628|nr:serine/threonine-protein kinase [Streptomyces sp. NBC_00334]